MRADRVALVANAVGTVAEALSAVLAGPVPAAGVLCDAVAVTADVAARQYETTSLGETR